MKHNMPILATHLQAYAKKGFGNSLPGREPSWEWREVEVCPQTALAIAFRNFGAHSRKDVITHTYRYSLRVTSAELFQSRHPRAEVNPDFSVEMDAETTTATSFRAKEDKGRL